MSSRRHRPTAGRVSVELEPIDAELVAVWYGLPEKTRQGIREFVLRVSRWQAKALPVSNGAKRRVGSSARAAVLLLVSGVQAAILGL